MTLALLVLQIPSAVAKAEPAPSCAPGQAPHFQFGFAFLKGALGGIAGDPVEWEHPDAEGISHQRTTAGRLV